MQKKKGKTTIPPLLTFNLKVGFTFSVLSPKACPYVMALSFLVILTHRLFFGFNIKFFLNKVRDEIPLGI